MLDVALDQLGEPVRRRRAAGLRVLEQPHRRFAHEVRGPFALGIIVEPLARALHEPRRIKRPVARQFSRSGSSQIMQRPDDATRAEIQRWVLGLWIVARSKVQRVHRPPAAWTELCFCFPNDDGDAGTSAGRIPTIGICGMQLLVAGWVVEHGYPRMRGEEGLLRTTDPPTRCLR